MAEKAIMGKCRSFKCNRAPSGAHLSLYHLLPLVKTRGYLTSPRWGENRDIAPDGAKYGSLGFQPEGDDSHVFLRPERAR